MYEILEKINSLKELNRRSKINKLREFLRHDELFKKVIIYATSDTLYFNALSLPKIRYNDVKVRKGQEHKIVQEIFFILDSLSGKGEATVQEKKRLAKLADVLNSRELVNRILSKNLKCGVSARLVNLAIPGLVESIPDKRCFSESKIGKINFPAYIDEDPIGMIMNIVVKDNKVRFLSRKGVEYKIKNDLLIKEIINTSGGYDVAMIGVCSTKDSKHVTVLKNVLRGRATREEHESIIFIVSEIMPLKDFWSWRCDVDLKTRYNSKFFSKLKQDKGYLRIPKRKIVDSYEEAKDFADNIIKNGGNGAIVKDVDSFWREIEIKSWISIRKQIICVLDVVAFNKDNKLLYCKSKCGFIKSIVQTENEQIKAGQRCKISFAEIISKPGKVSRSLFNPVFIEITKERSMKLNEIKKMEINAKKRVKI